MCQNEDLFWKIYNWKVYNAGYNWKVYNAGCVFAYSYDRHKEILTFMK